LAQLAGGQISRTFIHLVEHGRARPSPKVLQLIAHRTGKPIEYFLRPADRESQSDGDLAAELTDVAVRVKKFAINKRLNTFEREAMKTVEASLRQGAALARLIQSKDGA
jgi:transcriptional regulator with XRE-family HTH domain